VTALDRALDLAVDAAATYRLTRLATRDTFPPAVAVRERLEELPAGWSDIAHCPWCVSVWAGVAVSAARTVAPRAWRPVATALALSAVVGLASTALEDDDEPQGLVAG
jgi:hypothetical protein